MLIYEEITDKLVRIKLACSVNVQNDDLISEPEINIYFELTKKNKDDMIPLDKWVYFKADKKIEDCSEFCKLKLMEKKDNFYNYNIYYNKETENKINWIKINHTKFLYEDKTI